MRIAILIIGLVFLSCNRNKKADAEIHEEITPDTITQKQTPPPAKTYSNETFQNVTVVKNGASQFGVSGTARVFEAAFSWVVEDGHNELASGHEMTDRGAPEWGKFDFTLNAGKDNDNSTLSLILFEASAEDGSRQHELVIPLPE